MRFLTGFTFATFVLGLLLIVIWCVAASVAALGGPDIGFPSKLATSGGTMLVISGAIFTLLKSQEKSSADSLKDSESA